MNRAEIDAAMREVLAQLSTCSHVPAAGYGPSGGSGTDEPLGGGRPPGDLGEAVFARAYGRPFHEPTPRHPGAKDDDARLRILGEATDELEAIRGNGASRVERPAGETDDERAKRIVRDGRGWPIREAAVHFRVGESEVRKARLLGRIEVDGIPRPLDVDTGEPLPPTTTTRGSDVRDSAGRLAPDPETAERQDRRARQLTDLMGRGHSLAAAARLAGISRSTAERALGKRAA